jgi:subtilase family serine protease
MKLTKLTMKYPRLACLQLALASCLLAQPALSQSTVATAKSVAGATAENAPDPEVSLQVTLWLKLNNRQELEATIQQLYDPQSPSYHQWLQAGDLAQYAPTAAQVAAVKGELQTHGLTLLADDPNRLSVRAQGTLAQMQSAFHTQIGVYRRGGQRIYANTTPATLDGQAGELALAVSGLDNAGRVVQANSIPLQRPKLTPVPLTEQGAPNAVIAQAQATGDLSHIVTDRCFQFPRTFLMGSTSEPPYATYTGNDYDPGSLQCGFTAAQISEAYGVTEAHKRGLRGQGQTIVLMEFYGSPTIVGDVNTFSSLNHLPPLTHSNFKIVYPDGKPSGPAPPPPPYSSLEVDAQMDVEWAHAMAPEANIVLMVMPTAGDEEVQYGIYYAAMHRLGGVLSINYSTPEYSAGAYTAQAYDQVIALAAASGIAVNVAAGEDLTVVVGVQGNPNLPASSPHATAVGGTSRVVLDGSHAVETAYGTALLLLEAPAIDSNAEIVGSPSGPLGAGTNITAGGESIFFPKPRYQSSLSCSGRCVPDVSALADQLTGALVVYTDPKLGQVVSTSGGTNLSSALFSGIWSLANQEAGHWLGQAAPALSRMPPRAIHDIVPFGSATNVTGTYVDETGTATDFTPVTMFSDEFGPMPAQFLSAIQLVSSTAGAPPDVGLALAWGFGGQLTVTPGWDNMTGYGTPNGMAFIHAAAHERDTTR